MLETALVFAKAFERIEDLDPCYKIDLDNENGGLPNVDDWGNTYCEVIGIFL